MLRVSVPAHVALVAALVALRGGYASDITSAPRPAAGRARHRGSV